MNNENARPASGGSYTRKKPETKPAAAKPAATASSDIADNKPAGKTSGDKE